MEEKIFVGFGYGRFETEDGKKREYCNVFMLEDFSGEENEDYHFGGHKAVKYKCFSPDLFRDIPVGTRVQCYFDSKQCVSYMVPVPKQK